MTTKSLYEPIREQLTEIQLDIDQKTIDRERIDQEIKTLTFQASALKDMLRKVGDSQGKYSNMGITDAVYDLISTKGNEPGLLMKQVMEELKREGYRSNAQKPYNTVYSTCEKLAAYGKIAKGKLNGRTTYKKLVG